MRHTLLLMMLGSALACTSAAQTPGTDTPLSITIEAPKHVIKIGSRPDFKVRLKNNSQQDINASSTWLNGVNVAYFYDVRDSEGRALTFKPASNAAKGHVKLSTLKPGEEKWEDIQLPSEYFTRPGEYIIQLSRNVPSNVGEGVAKSNKVVLTIAP